MLGRKSLLGAVDVVAGVFNVGLAGCLGFVSGLPVG